MRWTLDTILDLDADTYEELKAWVNESAEAGRGEDSIDMDAVISAKRAGGPGRI